MAATSLNIVLTNDDGYNAPGIQTLYAALVGGGFDVHVVAPAVNQSAQGSSLGGAAAINGPIAITEFSPGNYFVDGRPATATLVGLDDLFAGSPPDLVISGTNRGENIGTSENISGTVNGALQGLFEGVPSIAISAGSFNGSYDAAFANSATFLVDFLDQLQLNQVPGQPILPAGEGLSINVPGNPALAGVAVSTVTAESSSFFPYMPTGPNTFAEGFFANTAPSDSRTAEGSLFLDDYVTVSPVDGNWGSTVADRDALSVRLGSSLDAAAASTGPLDILLLNEDGIGATGLDATRDALLAKGYDVTVLAPATDQSGVGSALFLNPVTVTRYDADEYSANGTPATLVSLGLDPMGLFNGDLPDLVVVGADAGNAVGLENSNHSATLGGAITALFNYGLPSIALTAESGAPADLATASDFLATLIANLQATQGLSAAILPGGVGLSINVPAGADAADFALTVIDGGTDSDLSVAGDASAARFVRDGAMDSPNPYSEGENFRAGHITVSPIDGNIAVRDPAAYGALASLVGTTYGIPTGAPNTLSLVVSGDPYQGDAQFVVTVDGQQVGGVQTVTASHPLGQSQTITLLDFFGGEVGDVGVRFVNDLSTGDGAGDRNLYVDRLTLNGVAYEGENASNGAGYALPTEAVLNDNGSLDFATDDALTLRVSGDYYLGDAQFVVRVDGQQVGAVRTATALHAAGQYQDVVLNGNFGDARSVEVEFVNDLSTGDVAGDRNLYVDALTLGGRTYQGESAVNDAGYALPTEAVLNDNGTLHFDHLLG